MAGRKIKKHIDDQMMKFVFADLGMSEGKHKEAIRSFADKHNILLNAKERDKVTVLKYLFEKGHVNINKGDVKRKGFKEIRKTKISPVVASKVKCKTGFYETEEWQLLRKATIKKYGVVCMKCGTKDCEMHVDHIKPRSKYPKLELDPDNLQVLCRMCNMDKSNVDKTDYRPVEHRISRPKTTIKFSRSVMKDIWVAARKMTEIEFATEMASRYTITKRDD